jgi:hypothetical protein
VGDGDDEQDEEPGPVARSTSHAIERDAGGAACQRSAPAAVTGDEAAPGG